MMVPPKYVVAIAMATTRIVDATASRLLSSDKDSPKIVQLLSIEALCGLPVSRISMSVLCLAGRSQKSTPASSAIGLDVVSSCTGRAVWAGRKQGERDGSGRRQARGAGSPGDTT